MLYISFFPFLVDFSSLTEKPVYKGPDPPPNIFNIRPGYRWDSVNRSSGFENERLPKLANRSVSQTDAYKWSAEDVIITKAQFFTW